VAAAAVHAVDVLRVAEVRSADGLGESLLAPRRGDQVNVVRHETVAVKPQAKPVRLFGQQFEIDVIVVLDEEDILAIIAPLRDVMRAIRYDNACKSGHAIKLIDIPASRKQ
jgi:hypothetical protein